MQCIAWHIKRLSYPVLVNLVDDLAFRVNHVCALAFLNEVCHELVSNITIQLLSQFMNSRSDHASLFASLLLLFDSLHRPILYNNALWLESINELLAKLDRFLLIMRASMHNDSLPTLFVLQNEHAVLEVKVNSELLWVKLDAP